MTNCVQAEYRDRRVIAALRPAPIVVHKITPQTPYLFGLHPMVFIVPSVLALALMLKDAIGALI